MRRQSKDAVLVFFFLLRLRLIARAELGRATWKLLCVRPFSLALTTFVLLFDRHTMTLRYPEVFQPPLYPRKCGCLDNMFSPQGSDAGRERGSQLVLPPSFSTIPLRGVCSGIPDVAQEIPSTDVFSEVCGSMVYHIFRCPV